MSCIPPPTQAPKVVTGPENKKRLPNEDHDLNDSDNEKLMAHSKRKKKKSIGKPSSVVCTPSSSTRDGFIESLLATPASDEKTITYNLLIFSISEFKKPKNKHASKNKFFQLKSTAEWDTVKAQLLTQIDKALKPWKIRFEDYEILFTVPRHSTNPLPLSEEDEYKFLLERALKGQDPIVNVMVNPSAPGSDKVSHSIMPV
jgi:hypothetical protein